MANQHGFPMLPRDRRATHGPRSIGVCDAPSDAMSFGRPGTRVLDATTTIWLEPPSAVGESRTGPADSRHDRALTPPREVERHGFEARHPARLDRTAPEKRVHATSPLGDAVGSRSHLRALAQPRT